MRGTIHGIWLTQPGGKLHPKVIPNISLWQAEASRCNFSVVLWTNINELAPQEIEHLKAAQVIFADHSLCKASPLYKYFLHFLEKGVNGDKTAFALASDILRMAILDLTEDDKYFIYVDPNDVKLIDLSEKLPSLDYHMSYNSWGLSFKIERAPYGSNIFDARNDILIALKTKNPAFFKDFLTAYWDFLEKNYTTYVKPTTDYEAQQAAIISNAISHTLFKVDLFDEHADRFTALFGNYTELCQILSVTSYLNSERIMSYGNSWLPIGDLKEELEELAKYGVNIENILNQKNTAPDNTSPTPVEINTSRQPHTYPLPNLAKITNYTLIFGVLLIVALVLWRSKNGSWSKRV